MSSWNVTFPYLPYDLNSLRTLPQAALTQPYETAALTVCALCVYPTNPAACYEMLDFLRGPRPLSNYDKQFIADRFRSADYVPRSYFVGATPENNYQPAEPLTIEVFDSPYSAVSDGYLTLYLCSGGADSPRQVQLRNKPSTGQWFLWEQMLLSGIRIPKAEDPWA